MLGKKKYKFFCFALAESYLCTKDFEMKKYSVATLLILVLIVLCLLMLGRVHRRLVVSINGFHQHATTITVGSGNSGICFHKWSVTIA